VEEKASGYYGRLFDIAGRIRVADRSGRVLSFPEGIDEALGLVRALGQGRKVMFIGNGGSAAIASHMSVDFWKNGGIRAVAFNDSSLLTCIGNDYGYPHVFEKPIAMFADAGDMLVAISSSGRSENILSGVKAAREKACSVVTLSGFDSDNPLSAMGDINFHVPSKGYGPVEVIHHSICHCILDTFMGLNHG
jgi:D-sedoheptulose 7-phosphate isomerase